MSTGDETGYGKPPRNTRFRKGRSGNPKGRPPGRKKKPPYEAVLGQMVTVREGGIERRVTAAEAFALYLTKQGLDGDNAALRQPEPQRRSAGRIGGRHSPRLTTIYAGHHEVEAPPEQIGKVIYPVVSHEVV